MGKMTMRRVGAWGLSLVLSLGLLVSPSSLVLAEEASSPSSFAEALEAKFVDPDRVYSSDVRWWLGTASATDDTLLEEIQNLYDGGFRGVELCMQGESAAPDDVYAYGSEMWSHKWKLMMNKLLDLGMGVYLTSGTNWATSNVPASEMDPASQEAMQIVVMPSTMPGTMGCCDPIVAAGESIEQDVQLPPIVRDNTALLGVYAYEINPDGDFLYGTDIDLVAEGAVTTKGDSATEYALSWTAPTDGKQGEQARYQIITMWTQGSYEVSEPAMEPCYTTNYFDVRGVEALRRFWEKHYLDEEELNQKILDGDVQLFMDSLEIRYGGSENGYDGGIGFTWWAEDAREEFEARKGYDILPYLFLVRGLGYNFAQAGDPYYATDGTYYDLAEEENLEEKIINDWQSFLTELYEERMLVPLKEWLNSIGIKTRVQISYGKPFEITEPAQYVDFPEAENLNQYDQADILRLHTAGAKLFNKVLSTETGGTDNLYGTSYQQQLRHIYSQYAVGFQRVIWHIWTAAYGYGNHEWPGYMSGSSFMQNAFFRWGSRDPSSRDYDEFNAHIGRVQELLQTGKARSDIGFIHNNWAQGMKSSAEDGSFSQGSKNWQFAHEGVHYRSTELQDHGYTYDYMTPDFLFNEDVTFNPETATLEMAGYKALVIYQDMLDADAAKKILELAGQGLPVVILDGAAVATPFNDGREEELSATMEELKALPNVRVAAVADPIDYGKNETGGFDDEVYEKMLELGVLPYAGFAKENHQILTQTRQDEDGNEYVFAYNYCPDDYHGYSSKEEVQLENHGTCCKEEIVMQGLFVPYEIDAWSGKVTKLGEYRYEDGNTILPVDIDFGNIALYAFEKVEEEGPSVVYTDAAAAYPAEDGFVIRVTENGTYGTKLSTGEFYSNLVEGLPEKADIQGWDVTVTSWTAGEESGDLVRTETIGDLTTENRKTSTVMTEIPVQLDTLTTWDQIPEVGKEVSGTGHYEASFTWDASLADGAYLDFGDSLDQSMKVWVNGVKVGGDISQNETKLPKSVGEPIGDGTGGTFVPEGKEEYTGGISFTKPVADIGEYLVDGENRIVIEYSSSLTNVQLSRGAIFPSYFGASGGWWDFDTDYRMNGPAQAVLIPYRDVKVTEGVQTTDLSEAEVELEAADYVYTGQAYEPAVLSVKVADATLTEGEDYTVSYEGNDAAGEAKALITGTGTTYGGTKEVTFSIAPVDIADAEIVVEDPVYTGAAIRPAVSVKVADAELTFGKDFVTSVENNKDVTEEGALCIVKGKGNYTGKVEVPFHILAKDLSEVRVNVLGAPYAATGEEIIPAVSVEYGGMPVSPDFYWGATALVPGLEYEVTFENNVEPGEATATFTGVGNYTGTVTVPFTIE